MKIGGSEYGHLSALRVREQQRDKAQLQKETSNAKVNDEGYLEDQALLILDEDSSADLLARASQSVDEGLQASSQFRSRRDLSLKSGTDAENNFDSILDDNSLKKLELLLKMVSGVSRSSIKDMLFKFFKQFPDDSDRVIILRKALKRADINENLKPIIKLLLKQLEQSSEPKALKAGINVALKARLFGQTLGVSPALLRSTYRGFLESQGDEIETYMSWISLFGYQKRHHIMKFIEEALLQDIDSLVPSCSPPEFGEVLAKLNQLKKMRTLENTFIRNLLSRNPIIDINGSEKSWLLFLFCIIKDPAGIKNYLADVSPSLEGKSASIKAQFYQAVYLLCKNIPEEFFADENGRLDVETELNSRINEFFKLELLNSRI